MTQHIKEQVIPFEQLKSSDLIIDCVYQSGKDDHLGSEVISRLVPFCQNTGGFRWVKRRDPEGKLKGLPAYVVLYTSMEELAWPDYLDVESVFSTITVTTERLAVIFTIRKATAFSILFSAC
ncbi:MAG: hypothetical protein V8R49_06540 [Duodenibacillus massiliensis]